MALLSPAWSRVTVSDHPYRWCHLPPFTFLPRPVATELARTFPEDRFRLRDASARASKSYVNRSRVVVSPEGDRDDDLPALWNELVDELLSPGYGAAVARLLGVAPPRALEIRLVRHDAGCWLAPHTDRADKCFSHVLYFNEPWRDDWGGHFQVLASERPDSTVARVSPRLGASVMSARSERSWHAVAPVRAEGPHTPAGLVRRSLLVHGLV